MFPGTLGAQLSWVRAAKFLNISGSSIRRLHAESVAAPSWPRHGRMRVPAKALRPHRASGLTCSDGPRDPILLTAREKDKTPTKHRWWDHSNNGVK